MRLIWLTFLGCWKNFILIFVYKYKNITKIYQWRFDFLTLWNNKMLKHFWSQTFSRTKLPVNISYVKPLVLEKICKYLSNIFLCYCFLFLPKSFAIHIYFTNGFLMFEGCCYSMNPFNHLYRVSNNLHKF